MAATEHVWVVEDSPEPELKSEFDDQQTLRETESFSNPGANTAQVKDTASTNGIETSPADMQSRAGVRTVASEEDFSGLEHSLEEAHTTKEGVLQAEALNTKHTDKFEDIDGSMAGSATGPTPTIAHATAAIEPEHNDIEDTSIQEEMPPAVVDKHATSEPASTTGLEATLEEPTEDLIPPDQIKQHLRDHFQRIYDAVDFSYCEALRNAPNPGLVIDGVGEIGFPLSDADICKIKGASTGTSQNTGEESIDSPLSVNPLASWEILGSMWRVQNPAWKLLLRSLLQKVEDTLKLKGTGRGTTIRRTCLILYGAGSTIQESTSPS